MATLTKTPMRNLSQIRGKNAFNAAQKGKYAGVAGGEAVKKIPAMIVSDGLLGALAFALNKGEGFKATFQVILEHLQDQDIHDPTARGVGDSLEAWFDALAGASAATLRQTTAEVLAYLTFFRRFAKKGQADGREG